MAQKTYNARVKWKRDTSANWTSNDPVLLDGEIIIVDTSSGETRFKVGDGTKRYSQLPFEDEAVRSLISAKVDKVSGKELSSNDYTDAEKSKLAGIAAGANKYTHPAYTSRSSGLYKMTVDSMGHVSAASAVTKADIVALGIPGQDTNTTYGNASSSSAGLMSATDKAKLDGIASGANKTTVDSELSSTSTNPVQNKVVNNALSGKAASNHSHSNATSSADGFMASEDKAKLDGIAAGANKYVHPTTSGNKHIPAGGSSGQILRWSSDGVAKWDVAPNGTAYTCAETLTGDVWIDGKPIYRVCGMQVRAMAAGTMTDIDLGIDPIENIICADVYLRQSAAWRPANYPNKNTLSVHTWMINGSDTEPELRIIMGNDMSASAVGYNIEYTKAADTPTYYWLPFLASNNDQGCVASASSIYTAGNQAFGAFNGAIDSWWASAGADTDRWVQVQMPYALKNMVVTLIDREDVSGDHRRANTAGAFLGSNDGASWTELFSFTDRNPDFVNGFSTTYHLNNATAYKYLRYAPAAGSYSLDFATSVADIRVEGEVVDA